MNLLSLLLLLGPLARATTVRNYTSPCPIGGAPTQIYEKLSADVMGGFDSDLVPYSTRGQWRTFAISTCPDNLLSLYGEDMAREWPPELKRSMEAALKAARAELSSQKPEDLEIWDRYRIAGRVYKALGREPIFVAQVYLEGSWTARDHAIGTTMPLQGPTAARAALSTGAAELGKPLEARQRKILLHNMARIAWRGGFIAERDQHIAALRAVGSLDDAEQAALARFEVGAKAEVVLQDLAISELRAALAGTGLDAVERARATYLLGDLLRRRGQTTEARQRLREVVSMPAAPEDLRALATALLSELDG